MTLSVKTAKSRKNRIKATALSVNLSSKKSVQKAIKDLGDYQREHLRIETLKNDEIAKIAHNYSDALDDLQSKIVNLQEGIQAYCESNRDDLTQNGKIKTVNFETGEAGWRKDPPSVRVTKEAEVITSLEKLGLEQFIRVQKKVNKDAVLLDKETAKSVAGISINDGSEKFFIVPFENKSANFVD